MRTEVQEFCDKHDACNAGRKFAKKYSTLAEVWDACPRADWMFWMLRKAEKKIDNNVICKFECRCVRETPIGDGKTVWDLLTDERSRKVVEVVELYIDGKASQEELRIAKDSANAVYGNSSAVAYAAYAADAAATAADAAYANSAAAYAAYAAAADAAATAADAAYAARLFQANLLRSMIGNPFKE